MKCNIKKKQRRICKKWYDSQNVRYQANPAWCPTTVGDPPEVHELHLFTHFGQAGRA